MREIPLSRGLVALVDDCDFDLVSQFKWFAQPHGKTAYARRWLPQTGPKRECVNMHRFILSPSDDMEIDHRNGNGLDNRRENLRVATHQQNSYNRRLPSKKSGLPKGLNWYPRNQCWGVRISVDGKRIFLGLFKTVEGAQAAYAEASAKYHGAFGRTG